MWYSTPGSPHCESKALTTLDIGYLLRTFFIVFRVKIKQGEKILTDSGNIYNTLLTGGRLGMFVYGQHDVIWSRLEARCSDRYNTP